MYFSDILQFDNSYSWVNSKTVHYEVELLEPDSEMTGSLLTQTTTTTAPSVQQDDVEEISETIDSTHLWIQSLSLSQ